MREVGVDDDKGIVNDAEGEWSLGGREMLNSMKEKISVYVVVVVLIVTVGVVVLMVVVGVVVLMIVVGVLGIGAVEVDFSGVIDIFVLGGIFVVVVVEAELMVGCVLSLVLWCSNGRGIFCNVLVWCRLE